MEDVHALFLPKAMSNHLSFQLEYDESLPKAVEGHRDSLYRVLLNLVGNAIKFTEQGSVVLRANKIRQTDDQQITVEFQIQDTGVGIPEDKHRVIFEKMQRLTPSYQNQVEGSGIGLYIVDQYVKRLCGDIQVKSKMGQGSTFTVSLPLTIIADATLVESIPPHSAPASKILGTEKKESTRKITATSATTKKEKTAPIAHVLLVEDTEIIQVVTQILLHDAGFSVDVAASGEEALEMFSPEKYDLIYMDIGLPVMTGYEATREIRAKEKALNAKTAIPIIALTGHGAVDVQTFCGEAGMQGVLSKPLSREQAEAVWKYFGEKSDSKVSGLTLLHDDPAPPANHEILEVAATIQMTGGKDIADSLITSFVHELETQVLPKIKTLILAHQQDELGFLLHQQLGSLAYVKAPRLEKKLADLQTLVHKGVDIDQGVYQDIEQEALSLIKLWVK
jgi:CheY-like chemotaxis protein